MIKLNGLEFDSSQYTGVGVLNVRHADRGELKVYSGDWILTCGPRTTLVVTDAFYQQLLRGELLSDLSAEAMDESLPEVDSPRELPSVEDLKKMLEETGYVVAEHPDGSIYAAVVQTPLTLPDQPEVLKVAPTEETAAERLDRITREAMGTK